MNQLIDFFTKLFSSADWPPLWQSGSWSALEAWVYIAGSALLGATLLVVPHLFIQYIFSRKDRQLKGLYYFFTCCITGFAAIHLFNALSFWMPFYRVTGLLLFLTAAGTVVLVIRLKKFTQGRMAEPFAAHTEISRLTEQNKALQIKFLNTDAHSRLLAAIIDSSDEAILSLDLEGNITSWNRGAIRLFGFTEEEAVGNRISIIIPPDRIHEGNEIITRIREGNNIENFETIRNTRDGQPLEVSLSISPVRNAEGVITGTSAIARNITQQKKAAVRERELEKNVLAKTRELAGVFERITDGFIMLDKNFCYTYANKKIRELTGHDPAFLIGKCVWDLFPDVEKGGTGQAFHKAMDEKVYVHNIDYYEPLDLWQENYIYPSEEGISVFIRNITEQKRSEALLQQSEKIYRTIASSIPGSVICLFDEDYRYLLIEGDILEKIGYEKEKLLHNKITDILPADRLAEVLPDFERVFRGENFTTYTTRNELFTLSRFVPLKDAQHHVYMAMVVVLDITEQKKAELEIAALNTTLEEKISERTMQLEAANKELESFSYSVSHDLRAPLRAISGYARILEEDYSAVLDAECNRLLSVIQLNANKMGALIDDLLAFSRLGKKAMIITQLDMNSITADALEELEKVRPAKTTVNITELDNAFGDASLVRQVMVNLLSNAIKYSSKKEAPVIDISSVKNEHEVIYAIRDNGTGFNPEYAHKLFGVFQRLHAAEDFEGTGVGLALAQRIISRHGEKVWAESEEGKGAVFYFSLPLSNKTNNH